MSFRHYVTLPTALHNTAPSPPNPRAQRAQVNVAGLHPVGVAGVENIDLSHIVKKVRFFYLILNNISVTFNRMWCFLLILCPQHYVHLFPAHRLLQEHEGHPRLRRLAFFLIVMMRGNHAWPHSRCGLWWMVCPEEVIISTVVMMGCWLVHHKVILFYSCVVISLDMLQLIIGTFTVTHPS